MSPRAVFFLISLCLAANFADGASSNANQRASSASASNLVALVETNTLDALAADLQKGDARTRMNAVRKLGESPDAESKRLLVDRFKQIPQPEPSSDSDQAEKAEVLRQLLPKLQSSERTPLLVETLHEEISGMKAAESTGRGRYYPKNLARLTITALEEKGLSDETSQELRQLSFDHSIPQSIRVDLLAAVLRHDLQKGSARTPDERLKPILSTMPVRPVAPIPWDIYNDPSKRVAYSKTETFQDRQREMGEWLKSDDAVRAGAYEALLHASGLTAVEKLVAALDQKSISEDRRDYLALLATDILRKQSAENPALSGNVAALVESLTKYVEGMSDAGAFSRRSVAAANLNAFWENTGQPKRIAIKAAGDMSATSSQQR